VKGHGPIEAGRADLPSARSRCVAGSLRPARVHNAGVRRRRLRVAVADDVEIHLGAVTNFDEHGHASAYLFVDDADAVAARWEAAGVEVHRPQDTEWGQHEGAVVDPDGNVIRFGSPIPEQHA
jgi:uncharacterized glyoxalase superfamily protein PhnB